MLGAQTQHGARYTGSLLSSAGGDRQQAREQMADGSKSHDKTPDAFGGGGGGREEGNFRWAGREGLPQGTCKAKSERHKEIDTY